MSKTVVIGLDGGNWDLIDPWIEAGDLPNIEKVVKKGVKGVSHSHLPPVTVPNWKCYSTGKNPGKLGVYRFDHLDVRTQEYVFHHSVDFKSAELWDYLNDEGYKTAIVNMPTTFPPREVNGVMVCGGPDAREGEYRMLNEVYTYPETLQDELESEYNYAIHPKPLISSKDERGDEVDDIHRLIDLRFEVAHDLFKSGEYDFLHVTSFYSNTLQHFFWREGPVYEAWQIFDEHIGRFLEFDDTNVILMSDHGCAQVNTVVHLNNWLQEEGYLSLNTGIDDVLNKTGLTKERILRISKKLRLTDTLARITPERIQTMVPWEEGVRGQRTFEKINWENTQAVANAQGLIYLTPERGSGEYTSLRDEMKEKLKDLETPDGRKVAQKVHRYEDLYSGEYREKAPDLIIEFGAGFHLSEATGKDGIFHETGRWEAENIPSGIFAATGPDITKEHDLGDIKISDITPTILRMMGCNIPTDIDGEPQDVCDYDWQQRDPIPSPHDDNTAQSDDQVRERLENLGYLN